MKTLTQTQTSRYTLADLTKYFLKLAWALAGQLP